LYKISRWAYLVQKCLRKVKHITLVNLLATDDPFDQDASRYTSADPGAHDEDIPFPEYLTWKDASNPIADHVVKWLTDDVALAARRQALVEIKRSVAQPGASQRAADYILRELTDRATSVPRPHFLPPGTRARQGVREWARC
jgi:lipid-A-disaccharide synthase